MEQPQEVEDEEHERVYQRVAAVDVAKASGVVCTRVPDEDRPGRRMMHVWTVKATRRAIIELADHLRCQQIEIVTLESTSDYWRIWWVVLEAAGLTVQLVNARHVKNVPGRAKTDPLTELPGGVPLVGGQVGFLVATVAHHDHRWGWAAGPVPAGGAAGRVAGGDRRLVRAVPAGGRGWCGARAAWAAYFRELAACGRPHGRRTGRMRMALLRVVAVLAGGRGWLGIRRPGRRPGIFARGSSLLISRLAGRTRRYPGVARRGR